MRLLLITLIISLLLSKLDAQVGSSTFPCKKKSFAEYAPGMKFYFPANCSISVNATFSSNTSGLSYNGVAGKTYIITDTTSFRNNLYYDRFRPDSIGNLSNDRVQRLYFITLRNIIDTNDIFNYAVSIDTATFLSSSPYPALRNNALIQGAIDWEEFEEEKKWLLQLSEIYTLFQVDGKRYEKVRIVDIIPGTSETPIGIIFKSYSLFSDTVFVNLCGTNVADSYITMFNFEKYFTCLNPQGKISDNRWILIRSGKPDISMTENEIVLTLGKPKQIEDTIEKDVHKVIYTFDRYIISFERDVIVKIVSLKTN